MPEQAKLKVFLCHASQDKPIVRDLYQRLSAEGWVAPWLDEENIIAGQEWEYAIEKAVESADVVIVLLSNVSVNKEGYIQKEIRYALDIALEKPEGTIFIIPLRLDDCVVPRKIKHWQYVDYFPVERLSWAYKKVLESLKVRASNKGIRAVSLNTSMSKPFQASEWQVREPRAGFDGFVPYEELPLKPAQPAEWQVIEPPVELRDRSPHTRPDNRQAGDWYICGASRRGKLHQHEATFREDEFAIEYAASWILVAVADGSESHHLSRVGSKLAVNTALDIMKRIVENESPSQAVAMVALQNALREAWKALALDAQRRKVEFRDLSTTLLLLMYNPKRNLVGVAQIGDGLIAAQLEDGQIYLLGNPESGEYSGQTYFLTNHKSGDLPDKCETPKAPGPIKYFFVMTDGMSDDLYPPQERLPGLIKAIPEVMASEYPDKALLELIDYNRPGSFDDRTLVVICKREEIAKEVPVHYSLSEQIKKKEEPNRPIDFGSTDVRRMPVYFLLECGDSMRGAPIMAVEQGVQLLHNELMGQPQAVEMVNLSAIVYSTYAQQITPLVPITSFMPPALTAGGVRNFGNALRVLGDCIVNDMIRSTHTKKGDYQALVFWITDGEPADDWEAGLKYLQERTNGLLGSFIALGVGDSVNTHILRQITPNVLLATDVTPDNLRASFKWVSQPAHQ